MALTRKLLKSFGIEDTVVDAIIEAHAETVNGLKAQYQDYDALKADAAKLAGVQKELDDIKKGDYKKKYDDEHIAFEKYKADQEKEASARKVKAAYSDLLEKSGVSKKRIPAILKITDFSGLELGEDGKFKDAENLGKKIKEDWKEFVVEKGEKGAEVNEPPKTTNQTNSRAAEIAKQFYARRGVKIETENKGE